MKVNKNIQKHIKCFISWLVTSSLYSWQSFSITTQPQKHLTCACIANYQILRITGKVASCYDCALEQSLSTKKGWELLLWCNFSQPTDRDPVRVPAEVVSDFKRVWGLLQNDYFGAFLLKLALRKVYKWGKFSFEGRSDFFCSKNGFRSIFGW